MSHLEAAVAQLLPWDSHVSGLPGIDVPPLRSPDGPMSGG